MGAFLGHGWPATLQCQVGKKGNSVKKRKIFPPRLGKSSREGEKGTVRIRSCFAQAEFPARNVSANQ